MTCFLNQRSRPAAVAISESSQDHWVPRTSYTASSRQGTDIGNSMFGKPLRRRSLLQCAGVLTTEALAPSATGCSSDDDALTFFFAANPDELRPRLRIVGEFERRHPDIKVRTILSGPGAMQQLSTFCAGGRCPDVLMAWEMTYAGLADRGVLLDLNTLLAHDSTFAAQLFALHDLRDGRHVRCIDGSQLLEVRTDGAEVTRQGLGLLRGREETAEPGCRS